MFARSMLLGSHVRLLVAAMLSALVLIGGTAANSMAMSSSEEKDLDLAAWCDTLGLEVVIHPLDEYVRKDVNAKSWRCAEVTYAITTGGEVGAGGYIEGGASAKEGPNITVGVDMEGKKSSAVSKTYSNITSIDMSAVCRYQYGNDWSAHIDDWSDPFGWKCIQKDRGL